VKKTLLLGSILTSALALVPSAIAGQGIGGCQLDGTANFAKPLTAPGSVTTTYDFSGALTNCQGSFSDKGGTVSAGQPITVNGVQYQPLNAPSLTGGCTNSDTSGKAFVDWGGGKYSVIDYTTKGAAAAVALTGTFEGGSASLTSVGVDANGNHTTISVPLAYGGDSTGGPLAFQPPDPTACNGAGVATAGIHGVIAHGNYQ
jgi:hypothetical protein